MTLFTPRKAEEARPASAGRAPRSVRWWMAGVGAVVLIGALVVTFMWPTPSPESGPPAAEEVAASSSAPVALSLGTTVPAAPAGDTCAPWPANTEQAALSTAPPTTWQLVAGMAAPSNPTTGPAYADGIRWCYARTPAGALFAVANYGAQLQDPNADHRALAEATTADTPARAAALAARDAAAAQATSDLPTGGDNVSRPQWVGFHFLYYSPELVSVDMAHSYRGLLVATTYTVRWENGDWKVVYPEAGSFELRALSAPLDVSYFTPWAGA